jgi:O-antigen/teichoic acid export membrane protein
MDSGQLVTPDANVKSATSGGLSLRRNFSWTATGNLVYAACHWGMLTVLAKLGTPEMVGQFALALAVTAPVLMFLNLQLRGVQATDAKRSFAFPDYLSLRAVTSVGAFVLIVGAAGFATHERSGFIVVCLVGLSKVVDAVSDVFYGMFQQHEQMDLIAKALMFSGGLALSFLSFSIWATGSLAIGATGMAAASFLVFFLFVLPRAKEFSKGTADVTTAIAFHWHAATLLTLFRTALPLGVVMLLISLNTNMPRYFLEGAVGRRELGIFAALAYLLVAGSTVTSALGQAASPRLAKMYADGRFLAYRTLLTRLILLGLALGLAGATVAAVAGEEVMSLLYTSEYAEHNDALVVLALAGGVRFGASFAGYGMTAARYFDQQIPVFVLVALTSLTTSWALIPEGAILGAAYVTLASAMTELVGSLVVVHRAIRQGG